ncbi:acylphosphatase-2-like [Tachysurus fulvidraco]|uniref:acylphosphatase-2-like n=1 Tax=Tachysurus fulvidraco TaxID=1234273 RepID=UPI000F4F2609|nr:acylphosphatase-2-like [Tachysurus fulvidraco]
MSEETGSSGSDLCSVDFEIFGNVQGVCFRMYTERKGLNLGLVGWVKNTNKGTVVGQVQGPRNLVKEMKVWLSKEGSPSSRITRAVFKNEKSIPKLELSGFSTRF